ncbi:hypothetical protein PR048_004329 [Dryococelus australis]|uniref:Uncharacterized protein n=1 Tax=Dryococelus australis TaxID=614101 RepID=A0ABQ9I551_9NEOP|nr:hypothetical protein PR048_004329 [Dryococelus australis]
MPRIASDVANILYPYRNTYVNIAKMYTLQYPSDTQPKHIDGDDANPPQCDLRHTKAPHAGQIATRSTSASHSFSLALVGFLGSHRVNSNRIQAPTTRADPCHLVPNSHIAEAATECYRRRERKNPEKTPSGNNHAGNRVRTIAAKRRCTIRTDTAVPAMKIKFILDSGYGNCRAFSFVSACQMRSNQSACPKVELLYFYTVVKQVVTIKVTGGELQRKGERCTKVINISQKTHLTDCSNLRNPSDRLSATGDFSCRRMVAYLRTAFRSIDVAINGEIKRHARATHPSRPQRHVNSNPQNTFSPFTNVPSLAEHEAAMTQRVERSPPTNSIPGGVTAGIFARGNRAGRYRWSAGFLGDLPFPLVLTFWRSYTLALLHPHRLSVATGVFHSKTGLEIFSRITPVPSSRPPKLSTDTGLAPGTGVSRHRGHNLGLAVTELSADVQPMWVTGWLACLRGCRLAVLLSTDGRRGLCSSNNASISPFTGTSHTFFIKPLKNNTMHDRGLEGRRGRLKWIRSDAEMKGLEKRKIPEKTRRPTASSGTIHTCKNSETRPGIESVDTFLRPAVSLRHPPPFNSTHRNLLHVRDTTTRAPCDDVALPETRIHAEFHVTVMQDVQRWLDNRVSDFEPLDEEIIVTATSTQPDTQDIEEIKILQTPSKANWVLTTLYIQQLNAQEQWSQLAVIEKHIAIQFCLMPIAKLPSQQRRQMDIKSSLEQGNSDSLQSHCRTDANTTTDIPIDIDIAITGAKAMDQTPAVSTPSSKTPIIHAFRPTDLCHFIYYSSHTNNARTLGRLTAAVGLNDIRVTEATASLQHVRHLVRFSVHCMRKGISSYIKCGVRNRQLEVLTDVLDGIDTPVPIEEICEPYIDATRSPQIIIKITNNIVDRLQATVEKYDCESYEKFISKMSYDEKLQYLKTCGTSLPSTPKTMPQYKKHIINDQVPLQDVGIILFNQTTTNQRRKPMSSSWSLVHMVKPPDVRDTSPSSAAASHSIATTCTRGHWAMQWMLKCQVISVLHSEFTPTHPLITHAFVCDCSDLKDEYSLYANHLIFLACTHSYADVSEGLCDYSRTVSTVCTTTTLSFLNAHILTLTFLKVSVTTVELLYDNHLIFLACTHSYADVSEGLCDYSRTVSTVCTTTTLSFLHAHILTRTFLKVSVTTVELLYDNHLIFLACTHSYADVSEGLCDYSRTVSTVCTTTTLSFLHAHILTLTFLKVSVTTVELLYDNHLIFLDGTHSYADVSEGL